MYTVSLEELFTENESLLRSQFEGLQFPRDKEAIEGIIKDVFDKHLHVSSILENLSAPDIALFQSALQVVESSLGLPVEALTPITNCTPVKENSEGSKNQKDSLFNKVYSTPKQFAAVGTTAAAMLATLRPNFLTILLGVVSLGINWTMLGRSSQQTVVKESIVEKSYALDTDIIMMNIKSICERIDRLMNIYTTNLANATSKLEKRPVPSLHSNYGYLIERLSELFIATLNNDDTETHKSIQDLFKTLKNYHYEFVPYSESGKEYFEIIETDAVNQIETVTPALLNNGECISLGKVFIPEAK